MRADGRWRGEDPSARKNPGVGKGLTNTYRVDAKQVTTSRASASHAPVYTLQPVSSAPQLGHRPDSITRTRCREACFRQSHGKCPVAASVVPTVCGAQCPLGKVFARPSAAVLNALKCRQHVQSDHVGRRGDRTRCQSLPICSEAPGARRSATQPESAPSEPSIRCCAPAPCSFCVEISTGGRVS